MTGTSPPPLSPEQLDKLARLLHRGAEAASRGLAQWLGRVSVVETDHVRQLPLYEAAGAVADEDATIAYCSMPFAGQLSGAIVFSFDDASGRRLASWLAGEPEDPGRPWTELAVSAAMETTNIVGTAVLNVLAEAWGMELTPQPPEFRRDFAASVAEFALSDQARAGDTVIFAETQFRLAGAEAQWNLMLAPDAASMTRLPALLRRIDEPREG